MSGHPSGSSPAQQASRPSFPTGPTPLSNVEAFSGGNGALTTLGKSQDFLLVRGDKKLTVSLSGCRMRNYVAESPITCLNSNALVQAASCVDKDERAFNRTWPSAGTPR